MFARLCARRAPILSRRNFCDKTDDQIVREKGGEAWGLKFQDSVFTDNFHFAEGAGVPQPLARVLTLDGRLVNESIKLDLTKETARRMLTTMVTSKEMDRICNNAQRQGRISFYMTMHGEEATVAGAAAACDPEDMVFAQYREAAFLMYRGYPVEKMLAQCMGTIEDTGKGRQMPVHYGSRQHNWQTISSPLGTQIPQAAGAGLAYRLEKKNKVVICFFGDGAASEGDFHAALNFASTLKSQTIFFCRNNGWAISTPATEQYSGDGIFSRGRAYGMRSIRIDGNDSVAVYTATKLARELCLQHGEPVLIEAMTYRLGDHSTSDDSTRYRQKSSQEFWLKKLNPVSRFAAFCERLQTNGI
eukprot:TRINITY_DN16567_c0_g1_i2.p1 TRINITY_DN16567_c0_g1~~TRINITY_DN16567_c0_g1_i2.p1  ORF type:complete len:373 (+),score=49.15 TRINITY_DN16567_c0_g1_i2:44-1120(+)